MSLPSFRQFAESLDGAAPYTWISKPFNPVKSTKSHAGRMSVAEFTVTPTDAGDPVTYRVTFSNMGTVAPETITTLKQLPFFDEITDAWNVIFANRNHSHSYKTIGLVGNTQVQQQVFATVLAIIKEFVTKTRPHVLEFSADEPNRQRLYDRLIRKYLKNIPPYQMIEPVNKAGHHLAMGIVRKP